MLRIRNMGQEPLFRQRVYSLMSSQQHCKSSKQTCAHQAVEGGTSTVSDADLTKFCSCIDENSSGLSATGISDSRLCCR